LWVGERADGVVGKGDMFAARRRRHWGKGDKDTQKAKGEKTERPVKFTVKTTSKEMHVAPFHRKREGVVQSRKNGEFGDLGRRAPDPWAVETK